MAGMHVINGTERGAGKLVSEELLMHIVAVHFYSTQSDMSVVPFKLHSEACSALL